MYMFFCYPHNSDISYIFTDGTCIPSEAWTVEAGWKRLWNSADNLTDYYAKRCELGIADKYELEIHATFGNRKFVNKKRFCTAHDMSAFMSNVLHSDKLRDFDIQFDSAEQLYPIRKKIDIKSILQIKEVT